MRNKKTTGALNLKQQFRQHGFKYTAQRQAVMDAICAHPELHMSSEEIYEMLKQEYPDLGIATVYRTLLLLEKMQLIRKTDFLDGCTRYELCDPSGHAHHHLICTDCGGIINMEEDLLDELEKQVYTKHRFTVKNHSVKFYGFCEKCASKKDLHEDDA